MKEKVTAIMNDQRLMDIARYKATNGMVKDISQDELIKEFAAMKKRILSGRTTVTKLEASVFSKYGVQEELKIPMGAGGGMGIPPGLLGPGGAESNEKHKEIEGFGSR